MNNLFKTRSLLLFLLLTAGVPSFAQIRDLALLASSKKEMEDQLKIIEAAKLR